MTTTYAAQLDSVQAAIEAIQGGAQSYTISTLSGSRTVTRPDLNALYAREERLIAKVARNGGIKIRGLTPT